MADLELTLRKLQKVAALSKGDGPEAENASQMLIRMVDRLSTDENRELNRLMDERERPTTTVIELFRFTYRPKFTVSGWLSVPNGSVYHADRNCMSLRRSKMVVRSMGETYPSRSEADRVICGHCGAMVAS